MEMSEEIGNYNNKSFMVEPPQHTAFVWAVLLSAWYDVHRHKTRECL